MENIFKTKRVNDTFLYIVLILAACVTLFAQTSSLVYTGSNNKLEYGQFANTGESNAVNTIPDFSYAGYMGGGIKLPDVAVADSITAIAGDARSLIQNAIDRVAAMPLNSEGFRGAVLLKAGKYNVSGPLYITASGIVLRGEGQRGADDGGTEIVATSATQHDLIQFSGNESSSSTANESILDTQQYPEVHTWMEFNVADGVSDELAGDEIITFHLFTDSNEYAGYSSKEDTVNKSPYLEITLSAGGEENVVTLFPTDDAYVRAGTFQYVNYGSEYALAVKYAGETNDVTRDSYLKFDLSGLEGSVQSAVLKLYTTKDLAGSGVTQAVYHNVSYLQDDSWNEDEVTYSSKPIADFSIVAQEILDDYVPSGSHSFELGDVSGYNAGDTIKIVRTPNDAWIDTLDMAQYDWTASAYAVEYERVITSIEGNTITVDAPIVQAISKVFGGGEVVRISVKGRLENCGIENMVLTSIYADDSDEEHGWSAVTFTQTENCWAKGVTAQYFGYSCIGLYWAYHTTVEECAMLDPKSVTTGSRKYSFYIDKGSFNLFQRCFTRGGRHDFLTGSQVAGPNVFVDCAAIQTNSDIGPHHRYATGLLFDNIQGGQIHVQNRGASGTGHGWAGAQTMFWNCYSTVDDIKVESPIGAMNWGIGCAGLTQNGDGYWESWGTHVLPRSLYYKQLEDRLGTEAVANVTIEEQRGEANIYDMLISWAGVGSLTGDDIGTSVSYYLSENLVLNQSVQTSNVYNDKESYDGTKAVDGNMITRWATNDGLSNYWLEVDFDSPKTFNKSSVTQYQGRAQVYEIQYWDGSEWAAAFSGTSMANTQEDAFESVTSEKVRLYIDSTAEKGPSIYEFEIYNEQVVLSKGKRVSVSSADFSHKASYAVDEKDSYWSAEDNTYPQWYKIDMDSVQALSEAAIDWLETDSVSYQYKIEVSDDDENYITTADNSANTESGTTIDELNVNARYVKVTITGSSVEAVPAGAYEIRILGDKDAADGPTSVNDGSAGETDEVPMQFELHQNYPNPFNPVTTIAFSLPETANVNLKVYNILGQQVKTLVSEERKAGNYEVRFDASHLSSGIYFYHLKAGNYSSVKKMVLLK